MKKLFLILLVFSMVSCLDDNNDIENQIECFPNVGAVAIIEDAAGSDRNQYCYNEDGTLKMLFSSNASYNSNMTGYYEFFYNDNGQIERVEAFIPGIIYLSSFNAFDHTIENEYTYDDEGKVIEIKETTDYNLTNYGLVINYYTYDYDESDRITTETIESEGNVDGQPISKIVGYTAFSYDDFDNIEKEMYYYNEDSLYVLSSVKTYAYDEYTNPFNFFPGRYFKNNITHIGIKSYTDDDSSLYTVDYVFDYDDMDRPVIKDTYYDSIVTKTEYIGYYKEEETE